MEDTLLIKKQLLAEQDRTYDVINKVYNAKNMEDPISFDEFKESATKLKKKLDFSSLN